jgi:hypothetical protein
VANGSAWPAITGEMHARKQAVGSILMVAYHAVAYHAVAGSAADGMPRRRDKRWHPIQCLAVGM